MKKIIIIILILLLSNCSNDLAKKSGSGEKPENKSNSQENSEDSIFRDQEKNLTNFLDSIGNLSKEELVKTTNNFIDSVNLNHEVLSKEIGPSDFVELKRNCQDGEISLEFADRLFPNLELDSSLLELENLPVRYESFGKDRNGLELFMVSPGYTSLHWDCVIYFFEGRRIIAKHKVFHRNGLVINSFDQGNHKYVYYKQNFGIGTGIWWYNNFYYKYRDGKLEFVLSEIENSNLSFPWGLRQFWIESEIVTFDPLSIKIKYDQSIKAESEELMIIEDSTLVEFEYDFDNQMFVRKNGNSKLSRQMVYSYYLMNNELLFINAHYDLLKSLLKVKSKREMVLEYLNLVKKSM